MNNEFININGQMNYFYLNLAFFTLLYSSVTNDIFVDKTRDRRSYKMSLIILKYAFAASLLSFQYQCSFIFQFFIAFNPVIFIIILTFKFEYRFDEKLVFFFKYHLVQWCSESFDFLFIKKAETIF